MKLELKAALRNDFPSFVRKSFRETHPKKLAGPYIDYASFKLEEIVVGSTTRLVVNVPPRHLKTFMCSVCLPAWILGRDPTAEIMLVA